MYKKFFVFLFFHFFVNLFSVSIIIPNETINIDSDNGYTSIKIKEDYQVSQLPINSPSIPSSTIFLSIKEPPLNPFDFLLEPIDCDTLFLPYPILPNQKPQALSRLSSSNPITDIEMYNKQMFPEKWILNVGSSYNKKFAWINYSVCQYLPQKNQIIYPRSFKLTSKQKFSITDYKEMYIKNSVKMNYETQLIIVSENFVEELESFLAWRRITGVTTILQTVETIDSVFSGNDLQDKIRNCIIHYKNNNEITYVSLIGDVNAIPHRTVFAFDCEYGAYPDENEIPTDMYYSCLEGDWNANQNNVFGENEDEVDFSPDVYVARIPANNSEELSTYFERLIQYEKGELSDYENNIGVSMDLWENSESEVCQQFIYEHYFPESSNIYFLFGNENSTNNVYHLINQKNPNIFQHTGHAGISALTLQDGQLNLNNLYQFQNGNCGVFYSIGCWSAAYDYDSIGESFLLHGNQGFLGYVGNSRYGWGAPSAAGFGFSELYQKEFFKLLFESLQPKLAEINALQKIPFIPYYQGTSVYKWVAYELNALGDAAFSIQKKNPELLNYRITALENEINIQILSEDKPITNAIISTNSYQTYTNDSGNALIPIDEAEDISVYKYGYQYLKIEDLNFEPEIYVTNEPVFRIEQGGSTQIERKLCNPTLSSFDISHELIFNENQISLSFDEIPNTVEANSESSLGIIDIRVKSIADSYQMKDQETIEITENVIDSQTDQLIAKQTYIITIEAPNLYFTNFSIQQSESINYWTLDLSLTNNGSISVNSMKLIFASNSQYSSFQNQFINSNEIIEPNDIKTFRNQLQFIEPSMPNDMSLCQIDILANDQYEFSQFFLLSEKSIFEDFEQNLFWESDSAWTSTSTYAYSGQKSLSCRPRVAGYYTIETPTLQYVPNTTLQFQYRYKMPMYGKDGVYFLLHQSSFVDTLLFLGAGGALAKDPYIENSWQQYEINIDDILLDDPEIGSNIWLEMLFCYSVEIEGFNDYDSMQGIGIFIDDLSIFSSLPNVQNNSEISTFSWSLYPNPSLVGDTVHLSLQLPNITQIKVTLYNIKGQKITTITNQNYCRGKNVIDWTTNTKIGSGIFLLKLKADHREMVKKINIIK